MEDLATLAKQKRKNKILLGICIVLAIGLRVTAAFWLGDTIDSAEQVRVFDQHSYHALAQALLGGRGYSFELPWYPGFTAANIPTAFWSFLYPLYLAGVYGLAGFHPLAARLIQAVVVGILETWLVFRLGRALFGETVGLLAAGLSAVYIYFIFYDATLMTEPFFISAMLALLLLGLRLSGQARDLLQEAVTRPAPGWEWALLGLVAGLASLLRQTVLFWLPVELLWIWFFGYSKWGIASQRTLAMTPQSTLAMTPQRTLAMTPQRTLAMTPQRTLAMTAQGGWRRWLGGTLLTLATTALFVLPWTARNYAVYGAFLPLNSNAGYAFYSANHPDHGARFDQDYAAPLPEDLLAQGLNEAEWNSALTGRGLSFIVEDPGRYARLTLSKAAVHFNFWFSAESSRSANLMRVLSFGVYLPFFIAGLILSWGERRRASLIYAFFIVFNLLHILTWAGIRYRLPVDAALMPFAALALYRLYQAIIKPGKTLTP